MIKREFIVGTFGARAAVLLLSLLFSFSLASQNLCFDFSKSVRKQDRYIKTINKGKLIGLGVAIIGALADGIVEGYEFDGRSSFERKWGVDRYGFWGSRSWQGRKFMGQTWDAYHMFDDIRKVGYIGGGIVIGIGGGKSNKKVIHFVFDGLIVAGVTGMAKYGAMHWVRH